jgi:hypothetical protein
MGRSPALMLRRADSIDRIDLIDAGDAAIEVFEFAGLKIVDPAMDADELASVPSFLDDGSVADVEDLLYDIEFDEAIEASFFIFDCIELIFETGVDVADVAQPIVDEAEVVVSHGRLNASAAIVATDDDVADVENIDSEL